MMPNFGQDFGPQGVHFEDPQFQQDKDIISSHPLFPLLRLIFQKCELATANPRDSSAGTADVCSAESFSEDISRFAAEFKNDPSRQWCYDPNSESDQLMVMAIGVLRLHLLELEKVHELCRSFTDRYIQCLKTKMPVEIVIDDRDSPPLSSNFDEFSVSFAGLGFSPAASDKQMSEGDPGSPRNNSSAMSQDGFPKVEHIEHTKLEPVSENNRLGVFTSDSSEYPPTVGDIDGIATLHATSPSLLSTPSLVQSMTSHPPISSSTLSTLEPSPSTNSLVTTTPPPTSSSTLVTHSSSSSRKRDSTSDSHDATSSSSKRVKKEDKDDKKPQPKKRGIFPKQATNILRAWLFQNLTHPYPSEEQKKNLSQQTGLTILQVNNWFINARRRIVQPMIDSSNRAMAPYTSGSYPSPDPYGPGMGVFPHPMHPGLQGFGGGMGAGMGLPHHALPSMPPPHMPPISRDGGMTNMFSAFGTGQLPNHHSMLGSGGGLHGIGNHHGYPSIPTLPPDLTSLSNSC